MNLEKYRSIDQALFKEAMRGKYAYLWPVNEKEEKERFLVEKRRNPRFLYRDLDYDPREIEGKLESLKIPDDQLGRLFAQKRRDSLAVGKIVENRGRRAVVQKESIKIYGRPGKKLVDYAQKLLEKIPRIEIGETVSPDEIKGALQEALEDYGLTDWSVKFSDQKLTTVYSSQKKITVGKSARFPKSSLARQVTHEIGVHVLRAANGHRQPLKIFATGLPGYSSTEEGLALYFEERLGQLDARKLRNYAGRVIAMDSVCQGLNFRQTFEKLKEYDFSDGQAWILTVRAYRGGGYMSDHIYLKGFLKVKEFARKEEDFKTLYLGKIGIEHLPLVRKLLKKRILKKAKYLPKFLNSPGVEKPENLTSGRV